MIGLEREISILTPDFLYSNPAVATCRKSDTAMSDIGCGFSKGSQPELLSGGKVEAVLQWPKATLSPYMGFFSIFFWLPITQNKTLNLGPSWRSLENCNRPNSRMISRIHFKLVTGSDHKLHHVTWLQSQKVKRQDHVMYSIKSAITQY